MAFIKKKKKELDSYYKKIKRQATQAKGKKKGRKGTQGEIGRAHV